MVSIRVAISFRPEAVLLSPRPCQITTGRGVSSEDEGEGRYFWVVGWCGGKSWVNASGNTTKALALVRSAAAMVGRTLRMVVASWLQGSSETSWKWLMLTIVSFLCCLRFISGIPSRIC